jgi:HxlR-like helix-turn-helix
MGHPVCLEVAGLEATMATRFGRAGSTASISALMHLLEISLGGTRRGEDVCLSVAPGVCLCTAGCPRCSEVSMASALRLHDRALQSRQVAELLRDKWRIVGLQVLAPGPLRTSRPQRAINRASPKMLTQTLRRWERDGLIERRIASVVPARVGIPNHWDGGECDSALGRPLPVCRTAQRNSRRHPQALRRAAWTLGNPVHRSIKNRHFQFLSVFPVFSVY